MNLICHRRIHFEIIASLATCLSSVIVTHDAPMRARLEPIRLHSCSFGRTPPRCIVLLRDDNHHRSYSLSVAPKRNQEKESNGLMDGYWLKILHPTIIDFLLCYQKKVRLLLSF